jgi:hypothetical protein
MFYFFCMFRWIQTSLFGPKEEAPEPARTVKATRPTARKAPLKISVPPSAPTAFLDRWSALNPALTFDKQVEVILVPRLRQGWRLEWRRGDARTSYARLRIPAAFLQAPDEVVRAMGEWARLVMASRGKVRSVQARPARQLLEKTIHAWLDQHASLDTRSRSLSRARAERRLDRLDPKGRHHDLDAILAAINVEYFAGALKARITWSRRWGGLSTQSHAKDAEGNPYNLITISRGYDSPLATADIVGGVVYHECLHIAVPPREVTETSANRGRRVVHGREFRRREREYRHYEAWRLWHAKVLPGIIRRGDQENNAGSPQKKAKKTK